jgi:uncharacterized protein (TIGR00297 family)
VKGVADEPIESLAGTTWRKAIPFGRDQRQSRALVAVIGSILLALTVDTIFWGATGPAKGLLVQAIAASTVFALAAWRLKAATPAAAAAGGTICLLVTFWTFTGPITLRSGLAPLITLFVLTFLATRAGRKRKMVAGLAEGLGHKRRGRTASQIIANLAAAGLSAALPALWAHQLMQLTRLPNFAQALLQVLVLAAFAEATADTVSSEIGQAFGGRPLLLISLRRVDVGTDGAVSLIGTLAGIAGAALVTGVGMWAMHMISPLAGIALLSGVAGLVFDSLLGAAIERRGWIGNDLVNFTSTLFAVVVAFLLFFVV